MTGSLLLALALFASPLLADSTGEWRSYGATAASTEYAPFDQIDSLTGLESFHQDGCTTTP